MLSTFELFLVLLSLSWLLQWADFFAFFLRVASLWLCSALVYAPGSANTYAAKGQLHCPPCPQLPSTLRRASCTVLPILSRQETSSHMDHRVIHIWYPAAPRPPAQLMHEHLFSVRFRLKTHKHSTLTISRQHIRSISYGWTHLAELIIKNFVSKLHFIPHIQLAAMFSGSLFFSLCWIIQGTEVAGQQTCLTLNAD